MGQPWTDRAILAACKPDCHLPPVARLWEARGKLTLSPGHGGPQGYLPLDSFRATAARINAFKDFSSILSPSRKSMARRTLPSRLELNRPEGSLSAAPLAKVILTTDL